MSEWPIKTLRKLADFRAEYEGSIPFTRSNFIRRAEPRRCTFALSGSRHVALDGWLHALSAVLGTGKIVYRLGLAWRRGRVPGRQEHKFRRNCLCRLSHSQASKS